MSKALCELCGEPMPPGEEMFKFHGFSGNCPKPPKLVKIIEPLAIAVAALQAISDNGPKPDQDHEAMMNSDNTSDVFAAGVDAGAFTAGEMARVALKDLQK